MPVAIDRLVRSRRKTIALVINPDGSLTVRAPLHMAEGYIHKFVEAHTPWIVKHQAKARQHAPPPPRQYIDGAGFLFLGKSHPLHIVTIQSPALTLDDTGFHLAQKSLPEAGQVFTRWYKKQARGLLTKRVGALAKQLGFTCQKVRISSARTRWGSCSSKGTLSFTWRLVMAPPEIVDYVVIHELVHTEIKNHSKTYWRRVAEILPDYKKHVRWLKQNGKFLAL